MARLHDRNSYLTSLYAHLGQALEKGISGRDGGGLLTTIGPTPPTLLVRIVSEFSARCDSVQSDRPAEALRTAIALFCAIYVECSELPLEIDFRETLFAASLQAGIAAYSAWKVFAEYKETMDAVLETMAANAEKRTQSVIQSAQEQVQITIDRNTSMQNQEAALRGQVQEVVRELKVDVETVREDARTAKTTFSEVLAQSRANAESVLISQENIKRHADAVREELRIDTTKKLWQNRALWSAVSFWLSAAAILFAFAAPIGAAYFNLDAILTGLRHIGDAATQGLPIEATNAQLLTATISRLAVITVPLAIYFWAVKLLVRFNARSMMLMDDARQRRTMMDVYVHLIENNGATQEERALVLNALFRPAPGHGPENVDPPNFTDLLNKAAAAGRP